MQTQKQREDIIISLLKSKSNWAFSVIDIVKETKIFSPYPTLNILLAKKTIDRKWFDNHYSFYLTEEWNKPRKKT